MAEQDYSSFLKTITQKQWERIGLKKRAGVCTPLFSLFSSKSAGVGEIPDLKLLVNWCVKTGMSIIQLLPMNEVGFNFRPYDAESTFALEPVYLALDEISGAEIFAKEIEDLRIKFPAGRERANYTVKGPKLKILWNIFKKSNKENSEFAQFLEKNKFWLPNFSLFKVLKNNFNQSGWEAWPEEFKSRKLQAMEDYKAAHGDEILFQEWIQWQLFLQFSKIHQYAFKKGVFIMGDLPFLVARDSADVWAHQNYFKLNLVSGAPPDTFFAQGQRWGMPPYHWEEIAMKGYDYLIEKVRYAQNFYDFFRIDHVVGTFRLWTISMEEPAENGGLNGKFDPEDEKQWEEHGRKILSTMITNADMLPCAEDLGVVPPCSYKVLEEFAVPGMDVQRWTKDWQHGAAFKTPSEYRKNSIAVISNHDMTSFYGWWLFEAGTVDQELFRRKCESRGISFEQVREKLFDLSRSAHGRLRWRTDISDVSKLLWALSKPEQEVQDFIGMYQESYDEKKRYWQYAQIRNEYRDEVIPELVERAFQKAHAAASIFSIQMLQDWLSLETFLKADPWNYRINFPGITSDSNWSLVIPVSLEKLNRLALNKTIKRINNDSGRI